MKLVTNGSTVGSTLWVDGKLIAENADADFGEVEFETEEIDAFGKISIPIYSRPGEIKPKFTLKETGINLAKAITPGFHKFEYRWMDTTIAATGTALEIEKKAFFFGWPTKLPGVSPKNGERPENEVEISAAQYDLFVAGKQLWSIGKLTHVGIVNGIPITDALTAFLYG